MTRLEPIPSIQRDEVTEIRSELVRWTRFRNRVWRKLQATGFHRRHKSPRFWVSFLLIPFWPLVVPWPTRRLAKDKDLRSLVLSSERCAGLLARYRPGLNSEPLLKLAWRLRCRNPAIYYWTSCLRRISECSSLIRAAEAAIGEVTIPPAVPVIQFDSLPETTENLNLLGGMTGAPNTSQTPPKESTSPPSSPSRLRAYTQWRYAIDQGPFSEQSTDREIYDWLVDREDIDGDQIASYETWSRYVRQHRSRLGQSKNSRRGNRPLGRSIIRAEEST